MSDLIAIPWDTIQFHLPWDSNLESIGTRKDVQFISDAVCRVSCHSFCKKKDMNSRRELRTNIQAEASMLIREVDCTVPSLKDTPAWWCSCDVVSSDNYLVLDDVIYPSCFNWCQPHIRSSLLRGKQWFQCKILESTSTRTAKPPWKMIAAA